MSNIGETRYNTIKMNTVGPDKRLNYYRLSPDEVIAELKSHALGLTNTEAERRVSEHGANTLYHLRQESLFTTLFRQFKNLFVLILLLSAALALYLDDTKTATILLIIAFLNVAVGFFQEYKAETLMARLEALLHPNAKVVRNGQTRAIDSTQLALGDIVYIEEGDAVPADLRVLDESELATNDFALTGESNPSRKFVHAISAAVPLAARHNLVFMGTTVATGTAHGIVIGTGMHTELGRIVSLSQAITTSDSPLQKDMNRVASRIAQGTIILAAVLAIVAMQASLGLKAAILFGIGIAAAMIPNGLAAEVNITLAQVAMRLARARVLVKKLSAIETLGATDIILTDKTGTLTKNEMTATDILIGRTMYHASGTGYEPAGEILDAHGKPLNKKSLESVSLFFAAGALASNAKVCQPDKEHVLWYVLGDPTEGAMVTLARKAGVNTEDISIDNEEIKEFQFDSGRKLMSSVRRYNDELAVFVKGAPEVIIDKSKKLWDHGHIRPFNAADRTFFTSHNDASAQAALRNLAVAYRVLPKNTNLNTLDMGKIEQNLTFLGIVSMQDPLHDDVPSAMTAARGAHIRVSVITGDYPATAQAITARAQLVGPDAAVTVITPEEFGGLSDTQILQLVEDGGAVFSRVSPEDKLRIVEIARSGGHVVAVTGDGINDAPALKRADIGVAMGKTGTDVAKEASEIVLLDDSFATLVRAIRQGRLTFANIRKAARCALTDNASELLLILISLIGQVWLHIPMAITAIQILAIDLIAQLAPITALGWDKPLSNPMHDRPRKLTDHILNRPAVQEFVLFGLLAAVIAYTNFLFFFARHGLSAAYIDPTSELCIQAVSVTYLTIVLCQFINLFLVRADAHARFFTTYLWSNKRLLAAFAISFFCIINLFYNPLVRPYFNTGPLDISDWLTAALAATIYLGARLVQRHTRKHAHHTIVQLHHEVYGKGSPFKYGHQA